ncbi:MAG: transposase [Bacilli bacterium]
MSKYILKMDEKDFINYFLDRELDYNMFNSDGSLNKNYNSFKKTGTIASIFEDYWEEVYSQNKSLIDKYRPNANEEVNKIINCFNKDLGCSVYECPNCHDIIFLGHTCKSRFCSSCGYKYKLERVENILQKAYNCKHRQIVFTIPKELRKYFFFPFENRIDILFKAVRETIYSILNSSFKKTKSGIKKYKSKTKYTPGFFAFLHTFGRDLKWNPHIHILIAEIKLSENNCNKWEYFDFNALSLRFQKILLDLLEKEIGDSFKPIKRNIYLNHKKGFYVYAEKKQFKDLKSGIEYVTRYCGRVPISENRIINYDGKNVTFSYNDHKDESYHEITLKAVDFIMLLLRHLLPKQYKIIRYYGFYNKKHGFHDKMIMLIHETKRKIRRQFLKHEISVMKFALRNPYNCPKCDTRMTFVLEIT